MLDGLIGARTAKAGMPTRTARPPGATASIACNAVASLPIASKAASTPRPWVSSRTCLTTSSAAGVYRVGGSEITGEIKLVVAQVASDDGAGTDQPGTLYDIEPDAAAANDQHTRPGRNPGVSDHRADAGGDTATDNRGMGEGQI